MGRLDGKVAIITGGARGSGAAAARLFVAEGAQVVLGDVLDDEGKAVAAELGQAARYVHLDVTKEDEWTAAAAETERELGRLDVLVNNAGILGFSPIEETGAADYMRMVEVNQLGVFLGMKAAAPAMRRAGGGSMINVSSVEGLRGMPGLVAYAATKFAVRGMTKVGAVELGRDKIRVNAICPGAIDTPMVRGAGLEGVDLDRVFTGIPIGRTGTADDVARLMLFLASDDSSYCNGAEFVLDGGASVFVSWTGHPVERR